MIKVSNLKDSLKVNLKKDRLSMKGRILKLWKTYKWIRLLLFIQNTSPLMIGQTKKMKKINSLYFF